MEVSQLIILVLSYIAVNLKACIAVFELLGSIVFGSNAEG